MEGVLVVLGAGSWGTALASVAATQRQTVLWARSEAVAEEIRSQGTNAKYLPGAALSSELKATSDLEGALLEAGAVLVGVPSHGMRGILTKAAPLIKPGTPVFSLAKGIEAETSLRMSQVIEQLIPHAIPGVVSGPNLALEVALGFPAAALVACEDEVCADELREALHSPTFRSYASNDVIGVEVAGATKNVLAIAAGIADGLGLGENARAMLITRGLAEMGRLGVALGGEALTFGGLAGIGDLIATATSDRSRNRSVGVELGRGRNLGDLVASMHMVAEGVKTAGPLIRLAEGVDLAMPICGEVANIVVGRTTPAQALASLMARPASGEFDDLAVLRRLRN